MKEEQEQLSQARHIIIDGLDNKPSIIIIIIVIDTSMMIIAYLCKLEYEGGISCPLVLYWVCVKLAGSLKKKYKCVI